MANTYTSVNIHFIFSTKNRAPLISTKIQERLWAFMGGIARENQMKALCIGGIVDHVHLLVSMPTTLSIAKGIQLIKGGSSTWVHETLPEMEDFAWQEGYGAFSVSISHLAETIAYIRNQEEHHRTKTFQENTWHSSRNMTSTSTKSTSGAEPSWGANFWVLQASLRDATFPPMANPAINRRATFRCPSGTSAWEALHGQLLPRRITAVRIDSAR